MVSLFEDTRIVAEDSLSSMSMNNLFSEDLLFVIMPTTLFLFLGGALSACAMGTASLVSRRFLKIFLYSVVSVAEIVQEVLSCAIR